MYAPRLSLRLCTHRSVLTPARLNAARVWADMMANPEEFWAEGAQAWFHASDRTDVNCGINTRTGLREALPDLAAMMEETFGDGAWSYRDENVHGWG